MIARNRTLWTVVISVFYTTAPKSWGEIGTNPDRCLGGPDMDSRSVYIFSVVC